jgi:CO/xanthine dehydrogenase FAD-binding subunit
MAQFVQPDALDTALATLAGGRFTPLAGGTDLYPSQVGRRLDADLLDVTTIPELRRIDVGPAGVRIGATATWSDVLGCTGLPSWFRGLRQAAREVGGVQIQNAGTVAGNLCNASPAADGVPALLALEASVELASVRGRRVCPLGAFVTGPRRTAREADEMVTAVIVPPWRPATRSSFLKLGARRYLVISIAMVAVTLEPDGHGNVARAAVAVGACSPVAVRLPALEARLVGRSLDARLADVVRDDDCAGLAPIDDVRASAAYRREAAVELVRRAIADAVAAGEGAK